MPSYYPKDSQAESRQLKVQRLSIPFKVTHSATAANVVLANDEPSVLFMKSEGVNQISAELTALGDAATYTNAPNDVNGIMNFFIQVGEKVSKIMNANVFDRVNGGSQPCFLGDADGLSTKSNIMLTMDSTINFATTDGDLCLVVEYIVSDGN